jgi:hypothetical protein
LWVLLIEEEGDGNEEGLGDRLEGRESKTSLCVGASLKAQQTWKANAHQIDASSSMHSNTNGIDIPYVRNILPLRAYYVKRATVLVSTRA